MWTKQERRTALRADIQMGGAWLDLCFTGGRFPADGGILAARGRHAQMHCFKASKKAPRSGMRDARRRLMLKGLFDGDYRENGC